MKKAFLVIGIFIFFIAAAQQEKTKSYYSEIKNYDLGQLWRCDSIYTEFEGEKSKIKFPEPYGFIGDNYQRFYIHITSVVKNKDSLYQYLVTGKTKVNNTICTFHGTIDVTKCRIFMVADKHKRGFLTADIKFYEDSLQSNTGIITGKIETNWFIGKDKKIGYDALDLVADGYRNNQAVCTWKGYKRKVIKKCHWGDFRIPDCGDLDIGVGDISINEKYLMNGWKNLKEYYNNEPKAKELEKMRWWK